MQNNSHIHISNLQSRGGGVAGLFLFVWGFTSHSRIFHSYGHVTINGKGLQIQTYARHLWPLSSEGSLACHTNCDTRHPFIIVISEDTHTCCLAFCSGTVTTCLYDYGLLQLGFEHPTFRSRGKRSNPLRHRGGM